ncbi:MAG TPA: ISNCY family transposase [Candidatus Limnocylindria bacterium]
MHQRPPRAIVLTRVLAGKVSVPDAALLLGLSERSIRRLRAGLDAAGPAALVHGNRGRQPAHTIDPALKARIVTLATTTYAGLNDSHLAELLAEREGIAVSRASVQRILRAAGIKSPRRHTRARYRSQRARRPAAGMLVQLDGSPEDWFGTGERATLQAAVDDATGDVAAAVFREHEDAAGYFALLRTVVLTKGVPLAVYSDKHSVFRTAPRERETLDEELAGEREPTQFGRALAELGIELILAHSPQAKGRVERLFGTLQDRLKAELRLAGITTIAAANAFLPRYLPRHNARFAIAAADPRSAWRALPAGKTVESVCCFKYGRIVAQDNTVRLDGVVLQLPPRGTHWSWARQRVEVRQYLDGSWSVHAPGGPELARSAVPSTPPKLRAKGYRRAPIPGVQPLPTPGTTSPWRAGLKDWHPAAAKRAMISSRGRPA